MSKANQTVNNTSSKNGLSYDEMEKHISFVFKSHKDGNITEDELYRQSGRIPYPSHCLLAAQLLLANRQIDWDERKNGLDSTCKCNLLNI